MVYAFTFINKGCYSGLTSIRKAYYSGHALTSINKGYYSGHALTTAPHVDTAEPGGEAGDLI